MDFFIAYGYREPVRSVWVPCEPVPTDIERQSHRLKGWALIRGATTTGPPFVGVSSALAASVHLPVRGDVKPHPETGVRMTETPGGPIASIASVPIDELRAVDREVRAELRNCGRSGEVEFHPDPDSRGYRLGTLVWPIERHPANRCRQVALLGAEREVERELKPV